MTIYRVQEAVVSDESTGFLGNLSFQAIHFQYPDGARDAETLLVDPLTGDIYIVSKAEPEAGRNFARLYKRTKPSDATWSSDIRSVTTLPLTYEGETKFRANTRNESPSGGDIHPQAKEITLKSDNVIHIYRLDRFSPTKSITSMLTQNDPLQIIETRDTENRESIAYDKGGDSLYTVTEREVEADRLIHRYVRVALADLASEAQRDTIYGGDDAANFGLGTDFYIGVKTMDDTNEIVDFRLSSPGTPDPNSRDLIIGKVGDMDFDGELDFDDIDDFVLALNDAQAYLELWGLSAWINGDIDGDGDIDFDDIDDFVALLMGG